MKPRKLSNGRWRVEVWRHGNRRSVMAETKAEALDRAHAAYSAVTASYESASTPFGTLVKIRTGIVNGSSPAQTEFHRIKVTRGSATMAQDLQYAAPGVWSFLDDVWASVDLNDTVGIQAWPTPGAPQGANQVLNSTWTASQIHGGGVFQVC